MGAIVASTINTEPMYFNNTYYPYYPKIREEDIGKDTTNSFVDTLRMSNIYLKAMDADYDGDQITCKGVYTTEANDELEEFMYSKQNFMDFGCRPTKTICSDCAQASYALTRVLPDVKITTNISFA